MGTYLVKLLERVEVAERTLGFLSPSWHLFPT